MTRQTEEQLVKYLTDVHSIEQQALAQMRRAPDLLPEAIAADFRHHREETESQERRVRERLAAHDASPAKIKDVAGRVSGAGMILFARFAPDTPGKIVAHAFSYEHMEVAAYELLAVVARDAGDPATAAMATEIAAEERTMASRLANRFDEAVEAALEEVEPDDLDEQLNKYLADAHALEAQSHKLLEKGRKLGESSTLAGLFDRHLEETIEQEARLERRLRERGGSPSAVKDAAMRLGALNWGGFMAAQPDTPPKLAGFAFALENLEIAGYELLRRVAVRAGDAETVAAVDRALPEERAAAEAIAAQWEAVLSLPEPAGGR